MTIQNRSWKLEITIEEKQPDKCSPVELCAGCGQPLPKRNTYIDPAFHSEVCEELLETEIQSG